MQRKRITTKTKRNPNGIGVKPKSRPGSYKCYRRSAKAESLLLYLFQRFHAQHNDFDFFGDFLLAQGISFAPELGGGLFEASDRRVHMLHPELVLGHERAVKKLVQNGKQVLLDKVGQKRSRL
jgi:hypothetical protein